MVLIDGQLAAAELPGFPLLSTAAGATRRRELVLQALALWAPMD